MNLAPLDGLEDQLRQERMRVDVSSVSFSVREIVRMFEEGELGIAPSYQRKYRWPETVASTFIESLFLGLPVPPIFVATNSDFRWEVVDGLQRISTLILFMSTDPKSLKAVDRSQNLQLKGLRKLSQLNDYGYEDLPQAIQFHLSRQPVQFVSLTDKSDRRVRFELFERLNAGAIALTPQEVRSAVYASEFITFVERLAVAPEFQSLLKLQESNRHDGTADEEVLKFFAYKNRGKQFTGSVIEFLNDYVSEAIQSFDFEREEEIFKKSCRILSQALDGKPFLRTGTRVTPLVQLEAVLVGIGTLVERDKQITIPPAGWSDDAELKSASTGGTNTRAKLTARVERASQLFSA